MVRQRLGRSRRDPSSLRRSLGHPGTYSGHADGHLPRELDLSGGPKASAALTIKPIYLEFGQSSSHNYYHADGGATSPLCSTTTRPPFRHLSHRLDTIPPVVSVSCDGAMATADVYRFSSKEVHPDTAASTTTARFYDPTLQDGLNRTPSS